MQSTITPATCFILASLLLGPSQPTAWAVEPVSANWELADTPTDASLRGLCAVDDNIIWASGSAATVLRSDDAGANWIPCGPKDYGELEFRCVQAWSAKVACVASAGTPAVLLRTDDGGTTWQEAYRAKSEAAFFDAMAFWDAKRGIAVSDPVDGRLLVVETNDGGKSWHETSTEIPDARPGEAAFAASNTSLLLGKEGRLWFGTGGAESQTSRLYMRAGWNQAWKHVMVPMPSSPAKGIFSVCHVATSTSTLIAVGGDYRATEMSPVTACISLDGGATWQASESQPRAYRSAATAIPAGSSLPPGIIAVGPSGTDFSSDGKTWSALSEVGFHSLSAGPTQVFACGSDGRFARLK